MKECRNKLNVKINKYRNTQISQIQFQLTKQNVSCFYLFAHKSFFRNGQNIVMTGLSSFVNYGHGVHVLCLCAFCFLFVRFFPAEVTVALNKIPPRPLRPSWDQQVNQELNAAIWR